MGNTLEGLKNIKKMKNNFSERRNRCYSPRPLVHIRAVVVIGKALKSSLLFFRIPESRFVDLLPTNYTLCKHCLFILSLLRLYHIHFLRKTTETWIQLSSHFYGIHIIGGHKWGQAMTFLENAGLIYRNNSYVKGAFCKSYRLHEDLLACKWKSADFSEKLKELSGLAPPVDPWARLQNHLSNWQSLEDENPIKRLGSYIYDIVSNTTLVEREGRDEEILALAEETQRKNILENEEKRAKIDFRNAIRAAKGQKLLKYPELETTVESIAAGYIASINAFSSQTDKYVKFHLDKKGKSGTNRVYTNVTNLKSIWRQDIRIDGEKVYNVDIRCSQPCLLGVLYDFSETSQEEKARFVEFVTQKDFYAELAALAPPGINLTRDQAKEQTFTLMFGKNMTTRKQPLFAVLSKIFPILARKILLAKEKNYKDLSFILQSIESDIMVLGVMTEIMEREIRALSIHDSILCKEKDIPVVKEIITRHFEKVTGFKPVLKI